MKWEPTQDTSDASPRALRVDGVLRASVYKKDIVLSDQRHHGWGVTIYGNQSNCWRTKYKGFLNKGAAMRAAEMDPEVQP